MNNSLTDMRSKLTEPEVRKNYVQMATAKKMKISYMENFIFCAVNGIAKQLELEQTWDNYEKRGVAFIY